MNDEPVELTIPPDAASRIRTRAAQAAKRLHTMPAYVLGYDERGQQISKSFGLEPLSAVESGRARRGALMDQLRATRQDVIRIYDAAVRSQGREVPTEHAALAPEAKLMSTEGRDFRDPAELAAWQYVVMDRLRLEFRQLADALEALSDALDSVPDPALLVVSERFRRLAIGMRPPASRSR